MSLRQSKQCYRLPSLGLSALTDISKGEKKVFRAFDFGGCICTDVLTSLFKLLDMFFNISTHHCNSMNMAESKKKIAPFKVYL